jgi:hypothetical protein
MEPLDQFADAIAIWEKIWKENSISSPEVEEAYLLVMELIEFMPPLRIKLPPTFIGYERIRNKT